MAKERGFVLTGYGSGNSVKIEKSPVVAAIAARRGETPLAVVLRWTLQHGVSVVPRTSTPAHIAENLRVAAAAAKGEGALDAADMAALDTLNQAHPYYWCPMPLLPPGAKPDC
jgi:2,5-diketo-D-gluconate reductase A